MNWNIDFLKKLIYLLEQRLDQAKCDAEVFLLQDDIYTIKEMMNYQEKRVIFRIPKSKNYYIYDRERFEEGRKFLLDCAETNLFKLAQFEAIRLPHLAYLPRKISFNEMVSYIEDFFLEYDLKLYEIYYNLALHDKISIGRQFYSCSNNAVAKGIMNRIYSTGDTYIYSRFIHNINSMSTLTHEIAHASQFTHVNDAKRCQAMSYSAFTESYAIFIEYLFAEFMQKTVHKKSAIDFTRYLLDDLIFQTGRLCSHDKQDIFGIREIYSKLLAFYWIALYHASPKGALSDINEFNQNYGILTDEEILRQYGIDNLIEGTKSTIKEYTRILKKN